jgi:signal transduction histidine kinase
MMLTEALWASGDTGAADAAAIAGIAALRPSDSDVLRRRLELGRLRLLEQRGELKRAAELYDAATANLPGDAPDLVCVLTERGYLRARADRRIEATEDLVRAYELARAPSQAEERITAGITLARLYSWHGLHDEALRFVDEAVQYRASRGGPLEQADVYFYRGDVLLGKRDYAAAEIDLRRALAIWELSGVPNPRRYARERLCRTLAEAGAAGDTARICRDALADARLVGDGEAAKVALAGLGAAALVREDFLEAQALFDQALSTTGGDLPQSIRMPYLPLRARARAGAGDLRGAVADQEAYALWAQAQLNERVAGQLALLRMNLENRLQREELSAARSIARSAELAASREAVIRNLVIALALLFMLAATGGTWLWRRRLEQFQARAAADERLAALSRLTGGIAHEFNNLLTVSQQSAGLLAKHASVASDPVASTLVDEIRQTNEISADVTRQLLGVARQQPLTAEAIESKPYIEEVIPLLRRVLPETVTLRSTLSDPPPTVWADRQQLSAALLNLVTNARDALPDGGVITVRMETEGDDRVRIEVVDNGIGMSDAVREHALEPFFTTKAVGAGSGIGLSVVAGFTQQSGGQIMLRSAPGRGTSVSLVLPAARGRK